MQAVAFGEVASPFQRAERPLERAVEVLSDHQPVLRIVEIPVIECGLGVRRKLFLAAAQSLAELVDAPIIVGIFKSPGGILVDAYITRDIAEAVVIFPTESACRTDLRMDGVGSVGDGLPKLVGVIAAQPLDPGVGDH